MTSKKELLTLVDKQQEQIAKYEAKLKDVVRAYKGLVKEKEALEQSLAALATPRDAAPHDAPGDDAPPAEDGGSEAASECGDSSDELTKKLDTLTKALATVTSEKNRIELSFQNDKRRLLADKVKLEQSLEDMTRDARRKDAASEERLQDMKSRLIVAQHERDQDSQNTAVMLRELESKLALERSAREKAEAQVEDARRAKPQPTAQPARPPEYYEKKITDLQNELEQVRSRLKRAEQQSREPPLLRQIQGEMEELRLQHQQAIQQEHSRAASVEESARSLAQSHEDRVANLEARLADLSLTVASYDRTRQEDLHAIQKLKDKVAELAQENNSLLSRVAPDGDGGNDVYALSSRLAKLKDQLIQANLHAPNPVDVEGILSGGENLHARCHQEYDSLKQEFEYYKLDSNKKTEAAGGACRGGCAGQLEELRQKVRSVTAAAQLAADAHHAQVLTLRKEVAGVRVAGEAALQRAEVEHRVAVSGLEQQLAVQQQRSLATLTQRDEEIQRLTEQLHQVTKAPKQSGLASYEAAATLLSQVSGGSEGPLLHHLEELARKDQEINQLRKEKRSLQATMREVQMAALDRQQAQQDRLDLLEEQVERYRRNVSREGENLEYLKNVVLQYMTSSEPESRQLMLNAIATILKFTGKEVEGVKAYNASWWWQPKGGVTLRPQ